MGRFDPGDLFVQSAVGIDEAVVVDAQLMKNGGIEVADMDRVLGHAPAVVIGFPVGDASLDPAAGHPDGEGPSVVIPSRAAAVELALLIDRASEFTPPDDEGLVEQSPFLEVEDEGRGRLIGVLTLAGFRAFGIPVRRGQRWRRVPCSGR